MIERGFDWLARVLFVLVALALFTLAISLVVSGSWQLVRGAFGGQIGIYNLMNGVGLLIVSLAIADVAKFVVEENVVRDREMRSPAEALRSLTKFMTIIIIALSLEGVVGIFEAGREKKFVGPRVSERRRRGGHLRVGRARRLPVPEPPLAARGRSRLRRRRCGRGFASNPRHAMTRPCPATAVPAPPASREGPGSRVRASANARTGSAQVLADLEPGAALLDDGIGLGLADAAGDQADHALVVVVVDMRRERVARTRRPTEDSRAGPSIGRCR